MHSLDPSFLQAARTVLEHLVSVARVDRRGVYWSSIPVELRDVLDASADQSLFTGTPGIAYFIGEYYRSTRDESLRPILNGAAEWMIGKLHATPKNLGLYNGFSGLLWTLAKIGAVLDEPRMINAARLALSRHDEAIRQLARTGPACLSAGFTGLLAALEALSATNPEGDDGALRGFLSHRLVAHAKLSADGIYWDHFNDTIAPPLAFFNGAAGVQYALSETARVYPGVKWDTLYNAALCHDDAQFDQRIQNWPDFNNEAYFTDRHIQRKLCEAARAKRIDPFLYAGDSIYWNSGAAGILLSRESGRLVFGSETAEVGIERALNKIHRAFRKRCRNTSRFALSDGWGGVAVSLLKYAQSSGRPEPKAWAREIGNLALERFRQDQRFSSAGSSGCARFGLLNGEAGHGYLMLTLAGALDPGDLLCPPLAPRNPVPQEILLPSIPSVVLANNFPKLASSVVSIVYLQPEKLTLSACAKTLAAHLSTTEPEATPVLEYELRRLRRNSTEIIGYYYQAGAAVRTNVFEGWLAKLTDEELLEVRVERTDGVSVESPGFTLGADGKVKNLNGRSFLLHRLQAPQAAEIPVTPLIAVMLEIACRPIKVRELQSRIVGRFPATGHEGSSLTAAAKCLETVRLGLRNYLLTAPQSPV